MAQLLVYFFRWYLARGEKEDMDMQGDVSEQSEQTETTAQAAPARTSHSEKTQPQ